MQAQKDLFEDLQLILKKFPVNPKLSVYKNPSVTEILSLTDEDVSTVWEKFQFGISKREMYGIYSKVVQPVLDNMRELPIVGKLAINKCDNLESIFILSTAIALVLQILLSILTDKNLLCVFIN